MCCLFLGVLPDILIIKDFLQFYRKGPGFFYKKGKKDAWQLSQQLVPLQKGEIYLCVERTGAKGVGYLTVQEIGEATRDERLDQRKLRYQLNLALKAMNLREYNEKYGGDSKNK